MRLVLRLFYSSFVRFSVDMGENLRVSSQAGIRSPQDKINIHKVQLYFLLNRPEPDIVWPNDYIKILSNFTKSSEAL
jgi:hypothetical protein